MPQVLQAVARAVETRRPVDQQQDTTPIRFQWSCIATCSRIDIEDTKTHRHKFNAVGPSVLELFMSHEQPPRSKWSIKESESGNNNPVHEPRSPGVASRWQVVDGYAYFRHAFRHAGSVFGVFGYSSSVTGPPSSPSRALLLR